MAILALAKVTQTNSNQLLSQIINELDNPPENDKWFSISLLKSLNVLTPFNADLGRSRTPILLAVCNSNFSNLFNLKR